MFHINHDLVLVMICYDVDVDSGDEDGDDGGGDNGDAGGNDGDHGVNMCQ
jgi:hypothetical protein